MIKAWGGAAALMMVLGVIISPVYVHAAELGPDEWIREAQQALKINPLDAKAYYNRGTGYYDKGEYDAAINDLTKAAKLEANAPDVYFNRGLSYRRQHKMAEAIADFSKAIELYSAQPSYYFERCNARIVTQDFTGAISDCTQVIRLSPDEARAYLMRGVARMYRGELDGALADGIVALQIDPAYNDARQLLYETLLKREAVIQNDHSMTTPHHNQKHPTENLHMGIFTAEKPKSEL